MSIKIKDIIKAFGQEFGWGVKFNGVIFPCLFMF